MNNELLGVLEGLLFVQGDEGLKLDDIANILEISKDEVKELLTLLQKEYQNSNRGIRIRFLGDAFKLTTKEEHRKYYEKLLTNPNSSSDLSPSLMEVLAIIAYKAPITRAEVDEIRGLASDYVIRKLIAKGLVKEVGKSKMPGRPNLYGVTHEFLDFFGLASITDLPKIDFNEENISEDNPDIFTSIYKENN